VDSRYNSALFEANIISTILNISPTAGGPKNTAKKQVEQRHPARQPCEGEGGLKNKKTETNR